MSGLFLPHVSYCFFFKISKIDDIHYNKSHLDMVGENILVWRVGINSLQLTFYNGTISDPSEKRTVQPSYF